MKYLKALCFILLLAAVAGDEEEADVTVEFSSHLTDRPIENAKNASIVTSDEIETRVPYNKEHQKLSAVYGIDANTSSLFENSELITNESISVQGTETNTTANVTDTKSKMKVECTPRVLPENEIPTVTVANSSTLLKVLAPVANKNSTTGDCVVVLFYSNQCVFSARMAPHFNALPRVFSDIAFYAVDVMETGKFVDYLLITPGPNLQSKILYVRYGLVYVPNVMLFHNSKPFARYNETVLSLDQFVKFINKFTGLTHNGTLNVTSADMIGPVPSTLTKRIDFVLILAWVFTLCCFCFGFAKSSFCKRAVEFFRNTWHEANATQHEHEE